MTPTPQRVIDRALSRVERQGDCIVSLYSVGNHGYAQIGWHESRTRKTQTRLVHRIAWEAHNGRIPNDMTVDHICHNRRCLRMDHLRLLSNVDNGRRNAPGRDFPIGWTCKHGHPESEQIQIRRPTGRLGWTCRACANESRQNWAKRNPNKVKQIQTASNWSRRTAGRVATPISPTCARCGNRTRDISGLCWRHRSEATA